MGSVSEKITFEGNPIVLGQVVFNPTDGNGRPASAEITDGGAYELGESIPVGKYKISIMPVSVEQAKGLAHGDSAAPDPKNIPKIYRTEVTTDLTAEIKKGSVQFDFDLKP